MKKTLVVGFDAASWEYLNPLLASNRMPTLQRLLDGGSTGLMRSTMPAHTPTAWATLSTGKNPGKHGVFDHVWRRPGTYEFIPVNSRLRAGTPFWMLLSQHGIRVGLVNVPYSHPADPVNGFVVGGFGTPSTAADVSYPPEVNSWVQKNYGSYEPAVAPELMKEALPEQLLAAEREHQRQQIGIAVELSQLHAVQVLVINLMLLDHANHAMPTMTLVEEAIAQTDADIGYLLAHFQPDNVMLFSDHGSRRVEGTFLLHAWLRDRGYFYQPSRTPSEKRQAVNWVLLQLLQDRWPKSQRLLRPLVREGLPYMPASIVDRFWERAEASLPFSRDFATLSEQFDYARSSLYFGGSFSGLIYFNRSGREPKGTISEPGRAALADRLTDDLKQVAHPQTGEPVIAAVHKSDALYSGPFTDSGPDLILDTYDSSCNVITSLQRGVRPERRVGKYLVFDGREFGRHSREGIFAFSGTDFRATSSRHSGALPDIPATLLYLYGVPIPDDYDGRVLQEALNPGAIAAQPITYQTGDRFSTVHEDNPYSADEQAELVERLRSLGYLD